MNNKDINFDLEKIYVENISNIDDLIDLIENRFNILFSKKKIKLIILDSIAGILRTEFYNNGYVRTLSLF